MNPKHTLLGLLVLLGLLAFSATSASAEVGCSTCRPWWHLASSTRPTRLPSEGTGEIIVTALDVGDAEVNGEAQPLVLVDHLPPGLRPLSLKGISGSGDGTPGSRGPVVCPTSKQVQEGAALVCSFKGTLPSFDQVELRLRVQILETAQSGEENVFEVTGADAPTSSVAKALSLSDEPIPFGLEESDLSYENDGGAAATQAGSHPFQQTLSIKVNQDSPTISEGDYVVHPAGPAKDVVVKLPHGLAGNPSPFPRCTLSKFLTLTFVGGPNECPPQTAVGMAVVTFDEPTFGGLQTASVPVFNVEPAFGEPARFAFLLPITPIYIDTAVRSGSHGGENEDYEVTASVTNISQVASLISSTVTLWGVPGDSRHASTRGWGCVEASRVTSNDSANPIGQQYFPCNPSEEEHPPALLTLPTSCGEPNHAGVAFDSWLEPYTPLSYPIEPALPSLDGCNQTLFSPAISVTSSTDSASAPSGLDFNLNFHDEGLISGTGLAQSQMKDTVVTLPEGMTINPSAGVGLVGCTPAEYARETLDSEPGAGCPNESKLGTVEVTTPLLTTAINGSLFIAQPYENPFPEPEAGHPDGTLVALYVVLKNPEMGILLKLAGKVTPNPLTGRLTTSFANNPQLPFDHFNFHFREGQQAPLISPSTCGTYTTQAILTPWSEPTSPLNETSSFAITKGSGGGACPSGGVPPFDPGITSGLQNNNAGAFSPFYLHLTRTDGEQEIAGFSTNLPEGLTGDLSGIPFCSDAAIEAARHKTGAQEEAEPSCPAASRIGHTLVGTGVGAVLAYVPGKIYLAGPFHGAPFSIVAVTSAVVGPFDLGTVVLRFGLTIDPYTARVSVTPTSSEPIPTILRGIVTHVRDIRVYIDRSKFTLNPTSCNPLTIGSTLNSDLGASKTVTSPFQASNCQALGFKPRFKVSTSGKTSRSKGASLTVKLSYPAGAQANIAKVKVDLPKQLPSRLTTLQKACTAAQFAANPAGCPAASRVGFAKAITPLIPVPLEGPAYFVSHGGEQFPDLIMVLQGYGVTIDLVGSTFINKAGITSSTFKTVPDQPVGSFELTLPQGPFSALAANGNLCKAKLTMPTAFDAQNGASVHQTTKIAVTGCPKAKKAKRKAGGTKRKGGKGK
jgi:hypothetical protein